MSKAFFYSNFEPMDDDEMFDQMINLFEKLRETSETPQPPIEPPQPIRRPILNDDILAIMRSYNMSIQDIQEVLNFRLD
jgi:hypothetical protein